MIAKIVLIILIFIGVVQAYDGEFTPLQSNVIEIEEGSTFDGVIRIWPIKPEEDIEIFNEIKVGKLNDYFFLIEKEKAQRSSFNSEVIEIRGLFAVIKAIKSTAKIQINIGEQVLSLDLRRITTIATAPPPQSFEFVDQPQKFFVKKNIPYFVILILVVGVLGWLMVTVIKKANKKKLIRNKKEKLIQRILAAEKREEIEKIPSYLKALGRTTDNDKIKEFNVYLNTIQFKEHWQENDFDIIKKLKNEVINAGL